MLNQFTSWLLDLVHQVFSSLWDFVVDAFINIVDLILGAVVALFALIPVPDSLRSGLGALWGQLDPGIVYIVSAIGLPQVLAMFGAAYAFRLARKVLTLFQW